MCLDIVFLSHRISFSRSQKNHYSSNARIFKLYAKAERFSVDRLHQTKGLRFKADKTRDLTHRTLGQDMGVLSHKHGASPQVSEILPHPAMTPGQPLSEREPLAKQQPLHSQVTTMDTVLSSNSASLLCGWL